MNSQCSIIESILRKARGEWVPMPKLVQARGGYAIHSRVNDLRRKGITIENNTLLVPNLFSRAAKESFYRIPVTP